MSKQDKAKEKARDAAAEAIRQIVDAAQVLTDVRPILTSPEDSPQALIGGNDD